MKFHKSVRVMLLMMMPLTPLAMDTASGETMDCSTTKISKKEVERYVIKPGDRPDREMGQVVRIDVLSSDNPELDGAQETVYVHFDQVGATGVHSGYGEVLLNSGEKFWTKWQGTHYLIVEGENWKLPFRGVFRIVAGTGKYAAIRGGGWYDGTVTETGLTQTAKCSAEY